MGVPQLCVVFVLEIARPVVGFREACPVVLAQRGQHGLVAHYEMGEGLQMLGLRLAHRQYERLNRGKTGRLEIVTHDLKRPHDAERNAASGASR